MPQVAVEKVNDAGKALPIFERIAQRLEAVERRAFELFEERGGEAGHELEDWLKAEGELLGCPEKELTEKDGAYKVRIPLPGFEAKDVEVTATRNEVIVHAATHEERKTQKEAVTRTEFGSDEVYRRFAVLNPINVNKVTAILEKGVLTIDAPENGKPAGIKTAKA
jgi:HSP20 family protein